MAFTNAAAVQDLLGTDWDGAKSLTVFIDTASALVARVITCAEAKGMPLTDAEKELLERWLAAHFYQQSDRGYMQRSTLSASGSFNGKTEMGLNSTMYGQSALTADPSGCLNAITTRARASMDWLGKPKSEQTDYVDRD